MRYIPGIPPQVSEEVRPIMEYLQQELNELARSFQSMENLQFQVLTVEPEKPRNGLVVVADGTSWNPGGGAGLYLRMGGAWNKL